MGILNNRPALRLATHAKRSLTISLRVENIARNRVFFCDICAIPADFHMVGSVRALAALLRFGFPLFSGLAYLGIPRRMVADGPSALDAYVR